MNTQGLPYTLVVPSIYGQVRAVSLDETALPRVDMIKIDIDGMEELAIAGATDLPLLVA